VLGLLGQAGLPGAAAAIVSKDQNRTLSKFNRDHALVGKSSEKGAGILHFHWNKPRLALET
jgi:hypothetical protein